LLARERVDFEEEIESLVVEAREVRRGKVFVSVALSGIRFDEEEGGRVVAAEEEVAVESEGSWLDNRGAEAEREESRG